MASLTLASEATFQEEINKSRFIARARRVASPDEAKAFIDQTRDPEATHNAWAYKIGPQCRFSDDGEVSGTAGKPILGVIEKQGFDQLAVLVTRFYGGVKLGTGGLVRAYGGTAAKCLQAASVCEIRPMLRFRLLVGFRAVGRVLELFRKLGVEKLGEEAGAGGITYLIQCEAVLEPRLRSALQDCLNALPPLEVME